MPNKISIEPGPAELAFREILADDAQLNEHLSRFCEQFSTHFTDLMGEDFTIQTTSSHEIAIGEFQNAPRSDLAVRRLVHLKPLPTTGCLVMTETLAKRMVELILGDLETEEATDESNATDPSASIGSIGKFGLSEVENRIATKFCDSLLRNFEGVFERSLGISFQCARSAIKPLMHIEQLPADQPCRIVRWNVVLQELNEPVELLIPLLPRNLEMLLPAEHDQTIALILSRFLPAEQAAEVLERLPFDQQPNLIFRIARMTRPLPGVLEDIAAVLSEEWAQDVTVPEGIDIDGPKTAAEILSHWPADKCASLLDQLSQAHADVAEAIQTVQFSQSVESKPPADSEKNEDKSKDEKEDTED